MFIKFQESSAKEKVGEGVKRTKQARNQLIDVAGLTLEMKAKLGHYTDVLLKEFNDEQE